MYIKLVLCLEGKFFVVSFEKLGNRQHLITLSLNIVLFEQLPHIVDHLEIGVISDTLLECKMRLNNIIRMLRLLHIFN